ncbi:hypothetical protein EC991_002671 [Linnemannia zychae]|nr:hypothetical protein EC991_002671 [Linnemannia zychae]
MRLFIDTTIPSTAPPRLPSTAATTSTTGGVKGIMGSTPPSSVSPSGASSSSSSLASSPIKESRYFDKRTAGSVHSHTSKTETPVVYSKTQSASSSTGGSTAGAVVASFASSLASFSPVSRRSLSSSSNAQSQSHSQSVASTSTTTPAPTSTGGVLATSMIQSVRQSASEQGRLLAARSRTSLNRFLGHNNHLSNNNSSSSDENDVTAVDGTSTVPETASSNVVSATLQVQPQQMKQRAKFFFCEDSSDEESDDEYEQSSEQEQEQDIAMTVSVNMSHRPSTAGKAPLLQRTTRMPVIMPIATATTAEEAFEEYDDYAQYDQEEEEEENDDGYDEDDEEEEEEEGPLFFGKKPSVTITTVASQPHPRDRFMTPTPAPASTRRYHLPPPPTNAGMERRQSLLSDLLLAEKQQKQLLLLHQQQQQQQQQSRPSTSSTCSTPNCLSAANSDGEGCGSTSSNAASGGMGSANVNGRPRFSTTALTPIYPPAPSTTSTSQPHYLSQRQHQIIEPNNNRRHRGFIDPPSETEPDNRLREDKNLLSDDMNATAADTTNYVPKLVRTKKFYHRLDTLATIATTSSPSIPCTVAVASATTATTSPTSPTHPASIFSPLSPNPHTPIPTCKISTLSPATPTTTTTISAPSVAAIASTKPTSPTAYSTAAASAAAAASASAATMAGWARSQVQVQIQSLVVQSTTTAQRAFLTASATLNDVLFRTGAAAPGAK